MLDDWVEKELAGLEDVTSDERLQFHCSVLELDKREAELALDGWQMRAQLAAGGNT